MYMTPTAYDVLCHFMAPQISCFNSDFDQFEKNVVKLGY